MKKIYLYQGLNNFLYLMFSLAIPIGIIVNKYDVVQNRTSIAVKGGFFILAFLLFKFGRFHFKRMIEKMKDGYIKRSIEQTIHLIPYTLIYLSILFAETHLASFKYTMKYIIVSLAIAVIFDLNAVRLKKLEG